MKRTQIQFPDPLYRRLKEIAASNDWALAEVVRRAVELYVQRFPTEGGKRSWVFPTLDLGGDYLIDPAEVRAESDAIAQRS